MSLLSLPALIAAGLGGVGTLYLLQDRTDHRTDKENKFDVLATRDQEGLSDETNQLIDLVTVDPDTFPVGSFKYRAHRYPGDIDIFEPVKACCNTREAQDKIARQLQGVARKLEARKGMFLGDFKAGIDNRFKIDIGKLQLEPDGTGGKVFNYDGIQVRKELAKLRDQDLLSSKEYDDLVKMAPKASITPAKWELLNEALRNLYILRWTIPELLSGKKDLRGGLSKTLSDALTDDTIVKLDLWAPLDGRYNEITNFFLIIAQDQDGNEKVLNAELGDRVENLEHDIAKYSSKAHRNSLKLAKRLWNRALFTGDKATYTKLYPLFDSDAAMLNQIPGESEIIRAMIEKIPRDQLPIKTLIHQIDGFKERLNNTFEIQFNTKPLNRLIDQIVKHYRRDPDNWDPEIITSNLEALEKRLKVPIEEYSKAYLVNAGLDT